LKKGNKGSHKTTHKNLAEITFSQTNFDEDWFRKQLTDAWNSTSAENAQMGEGSSSQAASGIGNSSSSEWVWWNNEGIWYRQTNGVDEWSAPPSGADSGWIYSNRQRKYFIRCANGAVLWQ
jgi:hypothetical protein